MAFRALICILLLLALPSLSVGGAVSPAVPLESPAYPLLDKLAGFGLIDSALQGSRPYTRLEVARQIEEAVDHPRGPQAPPVAGEILSRLRAEFAEELQELRSGREGYLKPLRAAELSYVYRDGDSALYPSTAARQFLLTRNNLGTAYREAHNGHLIAEADGRLGRSLLLSLRPELLLREGAGADLGLREGRLALALGPIELSAGRQPLWWGPGRHGGLILTANAEPLDMVRLTNPVPAELPWLFRVLGPIRFDLFVSRLEEDRAVPEPYFGGLRINVRPAPWLEIGASRTLFFGGEGRPEVDAGDFLTIVTGTNLSGDEDTSNQLAAVDVRLRLPFLWGAELYGELGGEDEAHHFISKKAYLAGLYLPRLDPTGRLDLRIEVADFTLQGDRPVWYRHGIYRSGYTHEGRILGHFAGGDSFDAFGELRWTLPGASVLALSMETMSRGDSLPAEEKHLIYGVNFEYPLDSGTTLRAGYARDQVEDFRFTPGYARTMHFASLGIEKQF